MKLLLLSLFFATTVVAQDDDIGPTIPIKIDFTIDGSTHTFKANVPKKGTVSSYTFDFTAAKKYHIEIDSNFQDSVGEAGVRLVMIVYEVHKSGNKPQGKGTLLAKYDLPVSLELKLLNKKKIKMAALATKE